MILLHHLKEPFMSAWQQGPVFKPRQGSSRDLTSIAKTNPCPKILTFLKENTTKENQNGFVFQLLIKGQLQT